MPAIGIFNVVLAILIFGFLILIHESGHFLFARLFNVTINEFSIGMGPKLISRQSKKTGIAYSLRLLPFGGFVSMAGEDGESEDENAFYKKPVWQRLIITAAGAIINIVLGVIVMSVIVISSDKLYTTEISGFVESEEYISTSEQGLMVGDTIISVGGTRVFTANDLQYEIMRKGYEPVSLEVERAGERITIENITFPQITEEGTVFGNRDFYLNEEEKTPVSTMKHAFARSYSTIKMVYDMLFDLIRGRYGVESLSGPVGVTQALGEAASAGFGNLMYLAVFISINLGVMNLLPLPALDGGRILFQVIELIRGKPVPVQVEGFVHFAGLMLLMMLLIFVTFKDITRLFG